MKRLCFRFFLSHLLVLFDVSATLFNLRKLIKKNVLKVPEGDAENPEVTDTETNVPPFSSLLSFFVRGDPPPSHPVRAAAVTDESGVQMRHI